MIGAHVVWCQEEVGVQRLRGASDMNRTAADSRLQLGCNCVRGCHGAAALVPACLPHVPRDRDSWTASPVGRGQLVHARLKCCRCRHRRLHDPSWFPTTRWLPPNIPLDPCFQCMRDHRYCPTPQCQSRFPQPSPGAANFFSHEVVIASAGAALGVTHGAAKA